MLRASRKRVVKRSMLGKVENERTPGMYMEIIKRVAPRDRLIASRVSRTQVGIRKIIRPMMETTSTASTMSL